MNTYQHKETNDIVTLTEYTATNKYGNRLLWVKCSNGKLVEIWESNLKKYFTEI